MTRACAHWAAVAPPSASALTASGAPCASTRGCPCANCSNPSRRCHRRPPILRPMPSAVVAHRRRRLIVHSVSPTRSVTTTSCGAHCSRRRTPKRTDRTRRFPAVSSARRCCISPARRASALTLTRPHYRHHHHHHHHHSRRLPLWRANRRQALTRSACGRSCSRFTRRASRWAARQIRY